MDYVSRFLIQKISKKFQKKKIKITKKGNFDGLCKQHFCSKNTKNIQKIVKYSPKGNSDG
jgi:hypothetical protein